MAKDERIFYQNIYYMLSYAFRSLDWKKDKDVSSEPFENIHDLFACILAKAIGIQLKQGFYREYIGRHESLPVMRGKINMPGTIKNRLARRQLLTCDFDEMSENNLPNRIIKTTARLLLRHGDVKPQCKDELKRVMLYFSNVDEIVPKSINWSAVRYQRGFKEYPIMIGICRLIIEGMLLTEESGEYRLASFFDDQHMCRLYEKFILEYYRRHFPMLNAKAAWIQWAVDDGVRDMLPTMKSDIHLQLGNTVLIIDAKYYSQSTLSQYNKHVQRSNNMYQIFTYVKNCDYEFGDEEHKVSGMLLYAKTVDEIQPDNVYQLHGNQISVKTLDLNVPFAEISRQLNEIAESHFDLNPSS